MDRRSLVGTIVGLVFAGPQIGLAQSPPPRPLVAVLPAGAWSSPSSMEYFAYGLRERGLEEGRDYDIVHCSTDGVPTREPALIAEVALNPTVIVTQTGGWRSI